MFKSLLEEELIEIFIDGEPVSVPVGVTVAAALLNIEARPLWFSKVDGAARAPYCMMGVCSECLITINGEPNQFACQRRVERGMQITSDSANGSGREV